MSTLYISDVKYDTPIEVSEKQYKAIVGSGMFDGAIFYQQKQDKFFIKVALTAYAPHIVDFLKRHQ